MKFMPLLFIILLLNFASSANAHSAGLNKQGCHAGSQPYHCHKVPLVVPLNTKILTDKVTHVRDGDTIEVKGIAVRLSALDCPERGTKKGDYATKIAKQFTGSQAMCELTGAKTYNRLVGYCSINGTDFGKYMMENSSCKVWEKYDVWDRY